MEVDYYKNVRNSVKIKEENKVGFNNNYYLEIYSKDLGATPANLTKDLIKSKIYIYVTFLEFKYKLKNNLIFFYIK